MNGTNVKMEQIVKNWLGWVKDMKSTLCTILVTLLEVCNYVKILSTRKGCRTICAE